MNQRVDLLKLLTVRTETIKLECLKNTNVKDIEFTLKEMNIAQNKKYNEILKSGGDDRFDKCMEYACREAMIEPTFFTDEEFKKMNGIGKSIMDEIFMKIPTIGMTAKEKKDYHKKVAEIVKKQIELDEGAETKK